MGLSVLPAANPELSIRHQNRLRVGYGVAYRVVTVPGTLHVPYTLYGVRAVHGGHAALCHQRTATRTGGSEIDDY